MSATDRGAVVVIGAVNMDIGGYPSKPLVMQDSNPGRVTRSLGGVGCNIARNLRLLEVPVKFLTALGGDSAAREIEETLTAMQIDLSEALRAPEESTSTYLFIADENRDMIAAIIDMDIQALQTPDYFRQHKETLKAADVIVLDANLSAEAIYSICENTDRPIFADAVSAAKIMRLKPALSRIHTLKPNRIEAETLTGISITDEASALRAAEAILKAGVKRVFITLGKDGVFCADGSEHYMVHAYPIEGKNMTGAGDAFTAALVESWRKGRDLKTTAEYANCAAAITAESMLTVNPALSPEALQKKYERRNEQ